MLLPKSHPPLHTSWEDSREISGTHITIYITHRQKAFYWQKHSLHTQTFFSQFKIDGCGMWRLTPPTCNHSVDGEERVEHCLVVLHRDRHCRWLLRRLHTSEAPSSSSCHTTAHCKKHTPTQTLQQHHECVHVHVWITRLIYYTLHYRVNNFNPDVLQSCLIQVQFMCVATTTVYIKAYRT